MGRVEAIHVSQGKHKKRIKKEHVKCKENYGILGDYYGGKAEKNISFLSLEAIENASNSCVKELIAGSFKENITTEEIDLSNYDIGTRIKVGDTIQEISKVGKTCNEYCEIYKKNPECKIPFKTVFTKVLKDGTISINDKIELL